MIIIIIMIITTTTTIIMIIISGICKEPTTLWLKELNNKD